MWGLVNVLRWLASFFVLFFFGKRYNQMEKPARIFNWRDCMLNALDFALFLLAFISFMIYFFVKFISRPKRRWVTVILSRNILSILHHKWKTNEVSFERPRPSVVLENLLNIYFTPIVLNNNEWERLIRQALPPHPTSHQIQSKQARARWTGRWATSSPTTNSLQSARPG